MTALESALEWLHIAELDLSSAVFLTGHCPLPVEIICFHCQQSAEKCLKSFIVLNNINPQKTHDLEGLCSQCIEMSATFNSIVSHCQKLNKYSVNTRYPNESSNTEQDMQRAIADAQAVLNFVKPLIVM
ncbi:hypothetical protein RsTz2092_02120 [Deferribacterales bacterium RsTz2092]|nr:hypothetical protein AGMMS49941_10740 [Deferribacterales bacterium]